MSGTSIPHNDFESAEHKFIWTEAHRRAAGQLEFAVNSLTHVTLMLGKPGVGKSRLVEEVVEYVMVDQAVAFFTDPRLLDEDLVGTVRKAVMGLADTYTQNATPIFVIDDAHRLHHDTLTKLLRMSHPPDGGGVVFKLVLVAQSGFDEDMQSIAPGDTGPAFELWPLDEKDANFFVDEWLRVRGHGDIFDDEDQRKRMLERAEGVPGALVGALEWHLRKRKSAAPAQPKPAPKPVAAKSDVPKPETPPEPVASGPIQPPQTAAPTKAKATKKPSKPAETPPPAARPKAEASLKPTIVDSAPARPAKAVDVQQPKAKSEPKPVAEAAKAIAPATPPAGGKAEAGPKSDPAAKPVTPPKPVRSAAEFKTERSTTVPQPKPVEKPKVPPTSATNSEPEAVAKPADPKPAPQATPPADAAKPQPRPERVEEATAPSVPQKLVASPPIPPAKPKLDAKSGAPKPTVAPEGQARGVETKLEPKPVSAQPSPSKEAPSPASEVTTKTASAKPEIVEEVVSAAETEEPSASAVSAPEPLVGTEEPEGLFRLERAVKKQQDFKRDLQQDVDREKLVWPEISLDQADYAEVEEMPVADHASEPQAASAPSAPRRNVVRGVSVAALGVFIVAGALLYPRFADTSLPTMPFAAPVDVTDAVTQAPVVQSIVNLPDDAPSVFRAAIDLGRTDGGAAATAYAVAAAKGESRAAYYLGQMYESGEGVAQDQTVALRWYNAASGTISAAASRADALRAAIPADESETAELTVTHAHIDPSGNALILWSAENIGADTVFELHFANSDGKLLAKIESSVPANYAELPADFEKLRVRSTANGDQISTEWMTVTQQ